MEKFLVNGGNRLTGEVTISGAKNAAVAILPATILSDGVCTIENLPDISDVWVLLNILSEMGASVRTIDKKTVEIDASHIISPTVPYELAKKMRASYYFLGSLLGKYSKASVSMPGGCDFGVRPIDQHLKGFQALGADYTVEHGMIQINSDCMIGNQISFDKVTVGATINVMLAAVRTPGLTIMENCAREPHVVDVANFLNSMGANIMGAGTDVIKIRGVSSLHGVTYSIIPDQIEAGTFMVAAAATGGNVLIKNVIPKHLESITNKLIKTGATVEEYDDAVRVYREGELRPTDVKTMPHPGFPTDMQPQFTTLLTQCDGTSIMTEGVWDNRFRYVDELSRMGAKIQVNGTVALVEGKTQLTGAPVRASDLRAGAAMVIAGLIAEGTTEIEDIYHIERGYDGIVDKLCALGADIKRVNTPDETFRQAL